MSFEILKRGMQLGRYHIREMLGRGGMGQVYRAWDPMLSRDVAIKVLGEPDAELLRRFSREAEAVSRLNHPNVVSILDFSVAPVPFIVMAHLRGEDLAARLKRGPLSVGEAVDILLGICAGVHACHCEGIIHRDLKPGNVFLQETPDGIVVKVLDFGVAILGENVSGDITRPGHVVGTPRYFSPEQVRHVDADAKSDQYAVGLLLYVALAGKSPFAGKEALALVRAILKADYPPLRELRPEVPPGLEAAVAAAMSVDKNRRFPSVLDFGRAIWEHGSAEGRALWADPFASAGAPPIPKTLPPNAVQSPMASMTTQHTASTVNGWAVGAPDASSTDQSPRSVMGAAVVVPLLPLEEAAALKTTDRLPTATAIDTSFGALRQEPTLDLHLWDSGPQERPAQRQMGEPARVVNQASAGREASLGREAILPLPIWRRRPVLAGAIVIVATLGGCIVWLLTRSVR